jgi:ribonuclease HII
MRLTFTASQPEVIAENHADDRYPVVGAASILAKVARDAEIAALREQFGDFGSGYCSDERTVRFLQERLRSGAPLPDCIRQKWGTVRRLRGEVDGDLPLTEEA